MVSGMIGTSNWLWELTICIVFCGKWEPYCTFVVVEMRTLVHILAWVLFVLTLSIKFSLILKKLYSVPLNRKGKLSIVN